MPSFNTRHVHYRALGQPQPRLPNGSTEPAVSQRPQESVNGDASRRSSAGSDLMMRPGRQPSDADSANGSNDANGPATSDTERQAQPEERQLAVREHARSSSRQSNGNRNNNVNGRAGPKPLLHRAKSDYTRPGDEAEKADKLVGQGARHGFEDHYQSEAIIEHLANNWYMYFTDKRHETDGRPQPLDLKLKLSDWRMRDRQKTVSAVIAVCLNIGVEPPDQLRTNPGAKLEAWQDTTVPPVSKTLETIGKALVSQYEALALRPRYKQYLDPSVEELKKFCMSLRRNAKDERVLLHYNGHGVPKPTTSGEIWVFNKNYTQYIPVSLYDLQQWLQAPTIYVWDCSEAGNILTSYERFIDKHEQEELENQKTDPTYQVTLFQPYIHLAACATKENLPTNPLIPADVFSCCLTTPMEMSLWFFVQQNPLKTAFTPERAKKLPGRLQDRRTPLGELNWIFTAITDTIAWTSLDRAVFRSFFRQDLLVAALFRNFLLAQRIMSVYNCHPQSSPALPDTRQHPLWQSWDLAVDQILGQLPEMERHARGEIEYEYRSSTFFEDQLTAFQNYLEGTGALQRRVPDQLPVVLQVLLSQQHRVRALILLCHFLDKGPWAVELALSIGIFPYVLKLLQSATSDLKPVMVFIWTRILAVDVSCQADLAKDNGFSYFAQILKPEEKLPVVDNDEHKAMSAFILAMVCNSYEAGQKVCNQTDVMTLCIEHLGNEENHMLRQWACLCLSQLWQKLNETKWRGIREDAPARLAALAHDAVCEVRAAVVYALTTLLGIEEVRDEVVRIEESLAWTVLDMVNDGSPLVRKEIVVFLSHFAKRYPTRFIVAAFEHLLEEREYLCHPPTDGAMGPGKPALHYTQSTATVQVEPEGLAVNTVYAACWKHVLVLSCDPHPEVQVSAMALADHVHTTLLRSSVGRQAKALMDEIARKSPASPASPLYPGMGGQARQARPSGQSGPSGPSGQPSPSGLDGVHGAHGLTRPTSSASGSSVSGPPPSPGLLRRTVSSLFSPFWGAEGGVEVASTGSRPSSRPSSRHSEASGASAFQRGSGRARSAGGELSGTSGPEDSEGSASSAQYHVAVEPVSHGFQVPEIRPAIPLVSTFLDWSTEYYREPQFRGVESDEPGSVEYNKRLWRRTRNEQLLVDTQPQKQYAGTHKWNQQTCMINNGTAASRMAFHQFEDHLAVADDGNTIQVWDWKTSARLNRFSNGNPAGSRISDLKYINEDDQGLLMAGSSDGVLRVYRRYDSPGDVELATAWRALTDMVPSTGHVGMVFDWQQVTGNVLVAGDVRVVRVWNAGHEACVTDIQARSGSCVTSLTSDQMTGNLFVAGFGDGAVRVYDTRLRPRDALVRKWKDDADHGAWIKSVHMQRGGQRELLSAARDGRVRLWDIRADAPLAEYATTPPGTDGYAPTLRTASTHEHLPVFAVGTSARTVKVYNLDGRQLNRIEPYSGFLQSRSGPIAATAFHPHKPMLACSARGDAHISLYTTSDDRA